MALYSSWLTGWSSAEVPQSLVFCGLVSRQVPFTYMLASKLTAQKETRPTPNPNAFQTSACLMVANVQLAKACPMAKPSVSIGGECLKGRKREAWFTGRWGKEVGGGEGGHCYKIGCYTFWLLENPTWAVLNNNWAHLRESPEPGHTLGLVLFLHKLIKDWDSFISPFYAVHGVSLITLIPLTVVRCLLLATLSCITILKGKSYFNTHF